MIKTCQFLFLCLVCLSLIPRIGWGASISIGSKEVLPGATVEIAVSVSVNEDLVGLHLRLRFDPEVLLSPSVKKGPLLNGSHLVDFFSPQEGELNIVAFSPDANTPLTAHEGVVLFLEAIVSGEASGGNYAIGFADTVTGPVVLPPSGLSGSAGVSIPHSVQPGSVKVRGTVTGDLDGDLAIGGHDLMLFSSWWREEPDATNLPANLVPGSPSDLIDIRDLLELLDYWRNLDTR